MKFTIQNPFLFIHQSGSDRRERTVRSVLKGQSVIFYHYRSCVGKSQSKEVSVSLLGQWVDFSSFRRADGTAVAVTEVLSIWLRLKPETNMGFCICCATCVLILNKVK